ncbi:hypothetical protein POV27_07220 [Aureisphaera galaxeae]|uniref:hypothetical protein n=1 Tax=Aureisphaera galaxeae TaxID=1538023 RepID=UPI0023506EF7|nr:hypothetical protein [Aureisphaera galaxeae]MDC8003836.1 hypothetical protein [Aureisphaera galaxeae]
MKPGTLIQELFDFSDKIRYVAIYENDDLVFEQRDAAENTSSGNTDTFEELLVNPTLLTLARQRGNIDCGGLNYLIVGYGNFFQLVKSTKNGHLSVCLEPSSDLNTLPKQVFDFVEGKCPGWLD